jgi:hypothetical protein
MGQPVNKKDRRSRLCAEARSPLLGVEFKLQRISGAARRDEKDSRDGDGFSGGPLPPPKARRLRRRGPTCPAPSAPTRQPLPHLAPRDYTGGLRCAHIRKPFPRQNHPHSFPRRLPRPNPRPVSHFPHTPPQKDTPQPPAPAHPKRLAACLGRARGQGGPTPPQPNGSEPAISKGGSSQTRRQNVPSMNFPRHPPHNRLINARHITSGQP